MTIRKFSLCWLYAKKSGRLSVDRIIRVRVPNEQKHPKRTIKNSETGNSDDEVETKMETDLTSEDDNIRNSNESEEIFDEKKIQIKLILEHYYAVFYEEG